MSVFIRAENGGNLSWEPLPLAGVWPLEPRAPLLLAGVWPPELLAGVWPPEPWPATWGTFSGKVSEGMW